MTASFTPPAGQPARNGPRYPRVRYTLPEITSPDANAFAIIGAVAALLRTHVGAQAASKFTTATFDCTSYQQLLELVEATVTVTTA